MSKYRDAFETYLRHGRGALTEDEIALLEEEWGHPVRSDDEAWDLPSADPSSSMDGYDHALSFIKLSDGGE